MASSLRPLVWSMLVLAGGSLPAVQHFQIKNTTSKDVQVYCVELLDDSLANPQARWTTFIVKVRGGGGVTDFTMPDFGCLYRIGFWDRMGFRFKDWNPKEDGIAQHLTGKPHYFLARQTGSSPFVFTIVNSLGGYPVIRSPYPPTVRKRHEPWPGPQGPKPDEPEPDAAQAQEDPPPDPGEAPSQPGSH